VKRECYTLCCIECQAEQALRVGSGDAAKLQGILCARGRDTRERVCDPGRLVSLSSERDRREIGRVGFDQQPVGRHKPEQLDISPLLECHDSAERHVPARGDGVLRETVRSGVAVEDTDYTGRPRLSDEQAGVVLRLPGMNDNWPSHLGGESNLRRKRGALSLARRVVVVVVEAALADRDGGLQELAQSRDVTPLIEGCRVVGMDSSGRKHKPRIPCRVLRGERRCLQRLSDADDSRRARIAGARDYRVAVAGERRVCEVGMAVDEDGRTPPVLRGHLRSIQRSTGAAM
jgi:hypothetical protein